MLDLPDDCQAAAGDDTVACQPLHDEPGAVIGPYKLIEQIGEGGFGVVYLAEQQQPLRRTVALKIIKPGMDTREVIARFESERQALALMDHPNIARVLDAGAAESGRPYFVMDLVRGIPMTEHCDEQQLTPRRRLELFVTVCRAVEHAHQKGIIHRDLKPSNVLVELHDVRSVPKVIDFGVAKVLNRQLTERTLVTNFAQMLGTPLYMSPEQAQLSGLDVDTRSDVYSLGVLLYELLTGVTPFERERLRGAPFDEIRRIIREDEPPLPSARLSTLGAELSTVTARRRTDPRKLNRYLRGDLDWIVMKCLEKDRTRRYATVGELAEDVEHCLNDEPIVARRPSWMLRAAKWTRRHHGAAGAVLAAIGAMIVMTAGLIIHNVKLDEANSQLEKALERSRQLLYAADMKFADLALKRGDLRQVTEVLQRHRPQAGEYDRRGVEWHYLHGRTETAHVRLPGHEGAASFVCYSADGRQIATAGDDEIVRVLDAATFEVLHTFQAGEEDVTCVAFSPDGRMLAASSWGGKVHVWDLASHSELHVIQAHEDTYAVVFSQDGRQLITSGDEPSIRLWDSKTGRAAGILTGHLRGCHALALSPDGRMLASASDDGTVKLWDLASGTEFATLTGGGRQVAVAFSANGSLVAAGGILRKVNVWETKTGNHVFQSAHLDRVDSVAFSPDGDWIASSDRGGTLRMWRLKSLEPEGAPGQSADSLVWTAHRGRAYEICFSPDGDHLLSAGDDGQVKRWSPFAAAIQRKLKTSVAVGDVAFTRDSRHVVTIDDAGGPRIWDPATGKVVTTLGTGAKPRSCLAMSPDGRTAAVGDHSGTMQLWYVERQSLRTEWNGAAQGYVGGLSYSADGALLVIHYSIGPPQLFNAHTVKRLHSLPPLDGSLPTLSPDGATLAVVGDRRIDFWDLVTGRKSHSIHGHTTTIQTIAFSPDGAWLATGSNDRRVKLWDAATGVEQFSLTGHHAAVVSLAFSPDGRSLLSADTEGVLKFWQVETGRELCELEQQPHGYSKIVISPDGRRLTCRLRDGSVLIHDLVRQSAADTESPSAESPGSIGEPLSAWRAEVKQRILPGHAGPVESVDISPDGTTIASGSKDGTIKLWDLADGKLIRTLEGHSGDVAVAFHPGGKLLASCGLDGTVRLRDLEAGDEVQELWRQPGHLVHHLQFSPDGRRLYAAHFDSFVRIWDVEKRKLLRTLRTVPGSSEDSLYRLLVSPDGQTLASWNLHAGAKLWNVEGIEYQFVQKHRAADGSVEWSEQVGNSSDDKALAIAVHGGNVYVGGQVAVTHPGHGATDGFLYQYDAASGAHTRGRWRCIGTGLSEQVNGVAVDSLGNVYAAGETGGWWPYPDSAGGIDAFVRKFDPNGEEKWTWQIGTSADEKALGVVARADGKDVKVYIAGTTTGTFPGRPPVRGDVHGFVQKCGDHYTAANEVWMRQSGSEGADRADCVAVDAAGNVYAAWVSAAAAPGRGAGNAFVSKYDDAGNLAWTRPIGASGADRVNGIAASDSGDVYVAGETGGELPGQNHTGGIDAFVRKYDTTGKVVWTEQFGTAADDKAFAIAAHEGHVYVAGEIADVSVGKGLTKAFVRKYDAGNRELLWVRPFGTGASGRVNGIAVDAAGNAYVVGESGGGLPDPSNAGGAAGVRLPEESIPLAFTPDGKTLIIGHRSQFLQSIDLATGRTLQKFTDDTADLIHGEVSPNGRWLATTYGNGMIRLWDVASGILLRKWLGHPGGPDSHAFCPRFTPDGNKLVTGGTDRTVRIWDLSDVK